MCHTINVCGVTDVFFECIVSDNISGGTCRLWFDPHFTTVGCRRGFINNSNLNYVSTCTEIA